MNDTVPGQLYMLCSPAAGMFKERTSMIDGNDACFILEVLYKPGVTLFSLSLPDVQNHCRRFRVKQI